MEDNTAQQLHSRNEYSSPLTSGRSRNALIRRVVLIIIALGLLVGFVLFIRTSLAKRSTVTLTNGGYTYTFQYYSSASKVQLSDKSTAFKYTDNEIAGVKPTNDPLPTTCSQIGSRWTKAFTISISAKEYAVCTLDDGVYALFFPAAGHTQLFTVAFGSRQNSAAYPVLQTTFSSVKVSK